MPLLTTCPPTFSDYCRSHPGLTDIEIGKHFRVTPQTVGNWRKLHGIPTRKPDYSDIDALVRQGVSTAEIMRITGWGKSTVNRRKRETGHGSGRNYVSQHSEGMGDAEPVKPTAEIIADLLKHKQRELGFNKEQMAAWLGGQAFRQTMEGMGR